MLLSSIFNRLGCLPRQNAGNGVIILEFAIDFKGASQEGDGLAHSFIVISVSKEQQQKQNLHISKPYLRNHQENDEQKHESQERGLDGGVVGGRVGIPVRLNRSISTDAWRMTQRKSNMMDARRLTNTNLM